MNPKTKMKKIYSQINYWLGVVAIGLVVGLSIQFAVAWKEPTEAPPGGNLLAPINVSSIGQAKTGNLGVNALSASSTGNALLVPNGRVGIGTSSPSEKLAVNGKIDVMGNNIIRVAWPANGTDAVNRDYVENRLADAAGGGGIVGGCRIMADASDYNRYKVVSTWGEGCKAIGTIANCENVESSGYDCGYSYYGLYGEQGCICVKN